MSKQRILIVEDDPGIARLVSQAVVEAGCEADTFATGEQALDWLLTNKADMLLLDNVLPDMHALDFLDRLEEAGRALPFIITTGQGSESVAVELMKRGAVDYLLKDVDFLDNPPAAIGRAMNIVDTQKRLREVEDALRQYRVETEAILEAAVDGIITFDSGGLVVTSNTALRELFGMSQDEMRGCHIEKFFNDAHGEAPGLLVPGRAATQEVRKQMRAPREFVATRADGSPFDAEVTFSEVEGSNQRLYLAIIRNISEKKRVERQLLHDAFHDKLTGLPNRALTINRISHALNRRMSHPGFKCAVMFIDLDRFKMVNDSMGHSAGDLMLTEVARRLMTAVRPSDTLARISGDEFAIVLEDIHDLRNAVHVADRVLESLGPEISLRGGSVKTNASIGIALSQEDGVDAEELLRRADIAMYRAKEKGRGRYEIFDIAMHSRTVMMMRTESDLRRAIGTDEIQVYYQPVIDLSKRVVAGFEALVRWNKPGRG